MTPWDHLIVWALAAAAALLIVGGALYALFSLWGGDR